MVSGGASPKLNLVIPWHNLRTQHSMPCTTTTQLLACVPFAYTHGPKRLSITHSPHAARDISIAYGRTLGCPGTLAVYATVPVVWQPNENHNPRAKLKDFKDFTRPTNYHSVGHCNRPVVRAVGTSAQPSGHPLYKCKCMCVMAYVSMCLLHPNRLPPVCSHSPKLVSLFAVGP